MSSDSTSWLRRAAAMRHGIRMRLKTCALLCALLAVAFSLGSCAGVEDKRIRQLLVEKGFGSRSQGNAAILSYVVGGDGIRFIVDPSVYLQPAARQLFFLTQPQPVRVDGTIFVPYLGRIYVLGATEDELSQLISAELNPLFTFDVQVQAQIIDTGKVVYAAGEIVRKGRIPLFEAEMTILDFLTLNPPGPLANYGRIRLIRPDAENPLVIRINLREMLQTGNTRYNILLRDNDIVFVPLTFFGHFARFLERLLLPFRILLQALFGVASAQAAIDFITGESDNLFFGFRGF